MFIIIDKNFILLYTKTHTVFMEVQEPAQQQQIPAQMAARDSAAEPKQEGMNLDDYFALEEPPVIEMQAFFEKEEN